MQTVLTRLTWKEQIADERLKLSYVFIHLAHPQFVLSKLNASVPVSYTHLTLPTILRV